MISEVADHGSRFIVRVSNVKFFLAVLLLSAAVSYSGTAQAKALSLWVAAKGAHSGGTSDLFVYFDGPLAGGLEGGLEFLNIDIFGEALLMGNEQYLFTGNLGFDMDFGDDLWLELGMFTGPIFFHFPTIQTESGPDWDLLSNTERTQLKMAASLAGFSDLKALEDELKMYDEMEEELSRWVLGWNLVRLRMSAGVRLFPGFHLGVFGQVAYHILIEGEDIAAGVKNKAIDQIAEEHMLPDEVTTVLRKALSAKPVDPQKLNGFNYNAGVMVKIQF